MCKEISHGDLVYDNLKAQLLQQILVNMEVQCTFMVIWKVAKNITTSRGRAKIFLKRFKPNNASKSEV